MSRIYPTPVKSESTVSNDLSASLTQPKILAVIVLYGRSIDQSPTCISIQTQDPYEDKNVSFLVYNNSPTGKPDGLPTNWTYVSDPTNKGLPAAYNYATSQARYLGAHWLLLLDQDSHLPRNFIPNLLSEVALCHQNHKIVAIVPLIFSNHRQVSPFLPKFGFDRPYKDLRSITSEWITAINSASAIRTSFIESIGGFSSHFWLDYLDHWLFRKIYDARRSVYVGTMKIDHDLSVANFNQNVNVQRYSNVLAAEADFTNRCLPKYWGFILALRLVARSIKHAIFTHNKRIAFLMFLAALKQISSTFSGLRITIRKVSNDRL